MLVAPGARQQVHGPGVGLRVILERFGSAVPDGFPEWDFVELVEPQGQVEPRVLAERLKQHGLAVEKSPSARESEAPGWQVCLRTLRFAPG